MITFGSVEEVVLPEWGLSAFAKIDTGAFSGAMHVDDLRLESTPEGDILVFRPLSAEAAEVRTANYSSGKVKNTSGETEQRYLVPITITVQGKSFQTTISLTSRTNMTFPIIIGRRMLSEYNVLVDVLRNKQVRSDKGENW